MSVHGNDSEKNAGTTAGTQPTSGAASSAQNSEGENLRMVGAIRSRDSERNEKLLQAVKTWMEKQGYTDKLHVFPLNAGRFQLRTSGVIIAAERHVKNMTVIFYATLYTETQDLKNFTINKSLPGQTFLGQGQQPNFDFPVTMFDVIGREGKKAAKACVMEKFPDANRAYNTHQFPILLEAQVDGKDYDPATMGEIMFDVIDSIDSKIADAAGKYEERARERIAALKEKVVTLKTETNPLAVCDVNGIPIRADLSFVLSATDANASQVSALRAKPLQIARADAYIQPMYHQQPRKEQLPAGYMPQAVNPAWLNTYFVPEVHITNLQPQGDSNNLEDILLALLSVTSVSDNTLAVLGAAFQPRKMNAPVNYRNIGALGLDCPHINPDQKAAQQGQRFVLDTSSDEFQRHPDALLSLLRDLFALQPIYMLHVPETGELSYRNRVFLEATQSGDMGTAAKREIISALDVISGGSFSAEYWRDEKKPMATLNGYRLPLGYYEAEDNVAYDLRRIDTLALKNIEGMNSDDSVNEWTGALYNEQLPTVVREMKILRVLRHHVPGMRITGRAHVVILEPEFLSAARAALLNSGVVNVQLQTNLQLGQGDDRVRGMQDAARHTATFDTRFSTQGGGYAGPTGPGTGYGISSRWD